MKLHLAMLAVCVLSANKPDYTLAVDAFYMRHIDGPCGNKPFITINSVWEGRKRINIASGERIHITLLGFGTDFAQDAVGGRIHEWIVDRSPPLSKETWVRIAVRARSDDGLGNRTVAVKWPTGTEEIFFKIVPNCGGLENTPYRTTPVGGGGGGGEGGGSTGHSTPNLTHVLSTPLVLSRSLQNVETQRGRMSFVNPALCANLAVNTPKNVTVPKFSWGVARTSKPVNAAPFSVVLINEDTGAVLDTINLPTGFPPNTPQVQRDNYPGRSTTIRVILNPTIGPTTYPGCFTEPGTNQSLDPQRMSINVDPTNAIAESSETDNSIQF